MASICSIKIPSDQRILYYCTDRMDCGNNCEKKMSSSLLDTFCEYCSSGNYRYNQLIITSRVDSDASPKYTCWLIMNASTHLPVLLNDMCYEIKKHDSLYVMFTYHVSIKHFDIHDIHNDYSPYINSILKITGCMNEIRRMKKQPVLKHDMIYSGLMSTMMLNTKQTMRYYDESILKSITEILVKICMNNIVRIKTGGCMKYPTKSESKMKQVGADAKRKIKWESGRGFVSYSHPSIAKEA